MPAHLNLVRVQANLVRALILQARAVKNLGVAPVPIRARNRARVRASLEKAPVNQARAHPASPARVFQARATSSSGFGYRTNLSGLKILRERAAKARMGIQSSLANLERDRTVLLEMIGLAALETASLEKALTDHPVTTTVTPKAQTVREVPQASLERDLTFIMRQTTTGLLMPNGLLMIGPLL